jgi:biotin carboxyl carrier protein
MSAAKVISVVAQPIRGSYICFEVGGILDRLYVDLGVDLRLGAKDITFEKLCDPLRSSKVAPGDPSRLQFDATRVVNRAMPFALAKLRNEMSKCALDTAINTRQNLYFSKYANSSSVISTIRASYSRTSPASKPNLLTSLGDIAEQQFTALSDAYMEDDRTGVVRATNSTVQTDTTSSGNSQRGSNFNQESVGENLGPGVKWPDAVPPAWQGRPTRTTTGETQTAVTVGSNYEESRTNGSASGTQSAVNVDYEYRTPYLDTRARHMRANISLIDQKFESFMFEQNVPHLEKIFENELASIDNDVCRLQIALLRSFLISPIPGIVTGIYKNPGDAVNAGEPVLRVENNDIVLLLANVVYRGAIPIGSTATVTTTLFGPSSPATPLPTGSVVAARGKGDRDQWEVVVQIDNIDASGNQIVPLGYVFDREYTDLTIP